MELQESVLLLTSTESNNNNSGTGFAVAYSESKLFILTCAHVVKNLDKKIKVKDRQATIEAIGEGAVDIALLSISWEDMPMPVLNRIAKGKQGLEIQVCGFAPVIDNEYQLGKLKGKLVKNMPRQKRGIDERVSIWSISIEDYEKEFLESGYSGSPVCDDRGSLVAIVINAKVEDGRNTRDGYAIDIKEIEKILNVDKLKRLIPSFPISHSKYRSKEDRFVFRECYYVVLLIDKSQSMLWPFLENEENRHNSQSTDYKNAVKKCKMK